MGAIKFGNSKIKLMLGDTKVKRAYAGDVKIYSVGNVVTYKVGDDTYQEEIDKGSSCLSPKTFTPALSGWNFVGWRQDTAANGSVLSSLTMGDEPITLYAVFSQKVTVTYSGNGATGGSTAAQTGIRYYNPSGGTVINPSFVLRTNGFNRTDYVFKAWALGSVSGMQYVAGASVALAASTTVYAIWNAAEFTMTLDPYGWSGPTVVQGSFSSIEISTHSSITQYGGVRLVASDGSSQPYAIGRITKTINTKGLPKATITLSNENKGRVTIGSTTYEFFTNGTTVGTIALDTSKISQTLSIDVCNYGDTYHSPAIWVMSIRFHD